MIKTFAKQNINSNMKTSNISVPKAVEYVGVSNGGASITSINLPTNTAPNDLVIFMMASDNTYNLSVPTDFTEFFRVDSGTSLNRLSNMAFRFSYRIMPDPLPGNISGISSVTTSMCMAFAVRNVANPPNLLFNFSSSDKAGNPNDFVEQYNHILQAFNFKNGLTVTGFFMDDDIATSYTSSPSGYTAVGPFSGGTSGGGVSGGFGYKSTTSDSVEQPGIWILNTGTDNWFSWAISFGPKSILG